MVGILTLDNQDLNGKWYDFGDYVIAAPGCGVAIADSYYSYMMPMLTMCHALDCELYVNNAYRLFDLVQYDFTDYKLELFNKYFKHWSMPYHPNTVDCQDDRCIIHCANFNILLVWFYLIHVLGLLLGKFLWMVFLLLFQLDTIIKNLVL